MICGGTGDEKEATEEIKILVDSLRSRDGSFR